MHIPIPEGLKLPQDASTKPFKLDGMFVVKGGGLMPLELGGQPLASSESENSEDYEEEYEEESEGYEEGCCDKCGGKGKMHGREGDSPKGNSFVIAIERSMKRQ
jgi:hypothetical protein